MERPTRTHERPVLVEQGRYGRAINTGRQQGQPASDKENKMPDVWEVEWGEEGTVPAPYTSKSSSWRPKDDKLLLKMRAGDKPAPWSQVVGTLYDKDSGDDARRRCDELEAFAEVHGRRNTQHNGPKGQKTQVRRKSFDADDESSTSSDENHLPAKKKIQFDRRIRSQSRKRKQPQGRSDVPRMFRQAGETTQKVSPAIAQPLSRGPSGIAGWTCYPKKTDQTLGKRIVEVSFGLFGINVSPSEKTGVIYRKW